MNYKIPIILAIIIMIAVVAGVLAYANSHNTNNGSDNNFHYVSLGVIHLYNTSPLIAFIQNYYNNSNISLLPQIIGNGTFNIISFNNTQALIGYVKAVGPLSSLAFYAINETLVKHGFTYAQYKSLLYDYKNNTAIGFDGYYFYLVKDNSSTNTTIYLLKYLYVSPKIFASQPSKDIIIYGTYNNTNFKLIANSSIVLMKSNYTIGNMFSNLTKIFKFFNITIGNFSATGKVVYKNSSVIVYSVNSTYDGKELYVMLGISNNQEVTILSTSPISVNEVLNEL
ncbi:hypothetical protein BFU36_08390 [Sulfolobus sp. A20]|uniref:hypothetical protein n=1 Tax=Sulfolobaceae TaxID=118883 RepID=UPI0008461D5F|nr:MULTISPECIES: hypothetical protein [unclassified Sulfolobus]TRM73555.1 hypothetical protein DJ528_11555 [Sulfolobus sp. B5]TRM77872.1 hypothetical protein DJ532_02995 [Sulfolobus sp. A20-N-F8]TRM81187.1 hypothetical protein DJ524_04980 [Sulfolobus sp. D5]TRM88765.1 hypothetical protein DJ521_01240 [Sulfolobus sp. E3]TRM98959.1 hypothetical protein DJ527_09505 [Sulfolobus sp. F1]TRN02173.1 hypothetical protein DJ530_04575 [Sulfolobus sp. E1]